MIHRTFPTWHYAGIWVERGDDLYVEVRGAFVKGHGPYGFDASGSGGIPGEPDSYECVEARVGNGAWDFYLTEAEERRAEEALWDQNDEGRE